MSKTTKSKNAALAPPPEPPPSASQALELTATLQIEAAEPPAEGKVALPRFRMLAYTGGAMRVAGWRYPVIVDLAGLAIPSQNRPIRFGHDASSGVGHSDAIGIQSGQLIATGIVSRTTPAAQEIVASSKNGLEWSNPRWQRLLSMAFGVLAVGLLCKMVGSVAFWVDYADLNVSEETYALVRRVSRVAREASPIICGLALCMTTTPERRYPGRYRATRAVVIGAASLVLTLGILDVLIGRGPSNAFPGWVRYIATRQRYDPWVCFIIGVMTCSYALELSKRGKSRLLAKLSEMPYVPIAVGIFAWLLNIDRYFWPLGSIVLDWLYPLSMIAVIATTIQLLLRSARESDANWITDP